MFALKITVFASALVCVMLSALEATRAPGSADSKLDAKTIVDAMSALPASERNAILKKFAQDLPGDVHLPARMKLTPDVEDVTPSPAEVKTEEPLKHEPEKWSMHYQGTVISQMHDAFRSPYESATSLLTEEGSKVKTSVTGTFFFGRKLWEGGELYFDTEIAGGKGFSGVTGIAGFPNGDITRVGKPPPAVYMARAFIRQTFNLGGEKEDVEGAANQLAGTRDEKRVVVTFGKIAASDIFDDNKYSHDPRGQFMNWSLMDNGAWDYAADTRGYSPGLAVEYEQKGWAIRYGALAVVKSANGSEFDYGFDRALSHNLEFEKSYKICEKEGSTKFLAFANNAFMGSYREAVQQAAANGSTPVIKSTRAYRTKYGFGINSEQQILGDLGVFMRAGWSDGHSESWMFTEIDRTFTLGLSLTGKRWKRPGDTIGLAGAVNGISNAHQAYLRAGGSGFIVGDGRLNYETEKIIEAYYKLAMSKSLFLTVDYQHVEAPAYNRDRGPVNVGGVRFHVEF